jgi:HEPN domain-containing protein
MDDAKRELVQNWLTIAQRDLAVARKVAAAPDPYLEIALYHCQQSAEKAVKGFLTFHDRRFEKTHDVGALILLAVAVDGRFTPWIPAGRLLTPYATEFRYPEERLTPGQDEFARATDTAQQVYDFVLSVLPPEVHPAS